MKIRLKSLFFFLAMSLFHPLDSAQAGDFANREILGFSTAGDRFAFEEYGRQDGSGFPYANIYVIDTATDNWTDGSPFRVLIKNEAASIGDARNEARNQAASALAPISQPGTVIASNSHLEMVADPYRVVAQPRFYQSTYPDTVEYRIETRIFPGQEMCDPWGPVRGFTLKQIFTGKGRAPVFLHEDTAIPDSRGCPLDYRFSDVITYFPDQGDPVVAILLLMEQVGFEGPDGRFLAITAPLTY